MTIIHPPPASPAGSPSAFAPEFIPGEHWVLLYTDSEVFLDTLEGFVVEGLQTGEGVIVIATTAHRIALHRRLTLRGFNLESAQARGQYFPLDARETLTQFIVQSWPDAQRFEQVASELLAQAAHPTRRVRIFAEMAPVLWAAGRGGAALQLEQLGQQLCQKSGFFLLCAYDRNAFTPELETARQEICATHTKVMAL